MKIFKNIKINQIENLKKYYYIYKICILMTKS